MTLEEALQAANEGNIVAINLLGNYFFHEQEYLQALEWFSRSANAGDMYGNVQAMLCSTFMAMSGEEVNGWTYALDNWKQAYHRCIYIIRQEDFSEDVRKIAFENLKTIIWGMGNDHYQC